MNEQCQGCGLDFDEWDINELSLCPECELERQGLLNDEDPEED